MDKTLYPAIISSWKFNLVKFKCLRNICFYRTFTVSTKLCCFFLNIYPRLNVLTIYALLLLLLKAFCSFTKESEEFSEVNTYSNLTKRSELFCRTNKIWSYDESKKWHKCTPSLSRFKWKLRIFILWLLQLTRILPI